jgi:uncharacterized protein Usg
MLTAHKHKRASMLGGFMRGDESADDFSLRLKGWSLATAEVLYYMPDHPSVLQSFVWQTLDLAPRYPRIHQFLDYWRREIEAVIHSVRLATGETLAPPRLEAADYYLHH